MSVSRRALLGGLLVATAACSATSSDATAPGPDGGQLVIATGSPIGVYYTYGAALAELLRAHGSRASVVATGASVENLQMVTARQAQVAFTALDAAVDAADGRSPFTAAAPVAALARLYDDYIHLVVPASSPVQGIADLRHRPVSVGSAGSGTALIADRILTADGLDPARDIDARPLGLTDSVAALHAGSIDAFFWSGGLPTVGVAQLAATMPVRLVPLATEATALRRTYGSYYRAGTIPDGTYPNVAAVETVAVADLLLVRSTMSADTAEYITSTLFTGAATLAAREPLARQLDLRTAIFTEPVALHEGALRYYRSAKSNG